MRLGLFEVTISYIVIVNRYRGHDQEIIGFEETIHYAFARLSLAPNHLCPRSQR